MVSWGSEKEHLKKYFKEHFTQSNEKMNHAVQTACGKAAPSATCGHGVHVGLDETGWLSGLEALDIPDGLLQEWNEAKASS